MLLGHAFGETAKRAERKENSLVFPPGPVPTVLMVAGTDEDGYRARWPFSQPCGPWDNQPPPSPESLEPCQPFSLSSEP